MATGLEESLRSAQTAFAQGRLAECRRECRALLERAPRDADVLHLAAIVEFQQANAAAALDLIGRAIAARPGDPRQHQSRGQMLKACGRPREAQADFRRALEIDPRLDLNPADLRCAETGPSCVYVPCAPTGRSLAAKSREQRHSRRRMSLGQRLMN